MEEGREEEREEESKIEEDERDYGSFTILRGA